MTYELDAARFASIVAELRAHQGQEPTARSIVEQLAALAPDADHVSLTVRVARGRHETLAVVGDLAAAVDAAQLELGEGPCLDDVGTDTVAGTGSTGSGNDRGGRGVGDVARPGWFHSGDLRNDRRWPQWAPAAADLGIGSLLAVQLLNHDNGHVQGALTLYASRTGAFADPEVVDNVLVYAVHAAGSLTSARLVTHLRTALDSRHEIGVAQGILIAQYGLTLETSFALLGRLASTAEVKLRDIAAQVVIDGGLSPSLEPPAAPSPTEG